MEPEKLELQREIGYNIKCWREERKLSRDAAASAAGCSQTHWTQVETGHKSLRVLLLLKLANVLNVTPDSIYFGKNEHTELQNIIRLCASMDVDQLAAVEHICFALLNSSHKPKQECAQLEPPPKK